MELLNEDCSECLFKSKLCKGLTYDEFNSIFKLTTHNSYKKGEVIFKQGARTNNLIFLTEGIVKFVYSNNGKELIVTIDRAQTLLGLANILNEDINIFSIVAIEDCKGCVIDLPTFKQQMIDNRQFTLEIMSISTQMFRKSIFNFISVAHKQSNGRVADILIYLAEHIYQCFNFSTSLSRQELADFAGCSKEQIIHTLRNFDADGIIRVSGKNIEILDLERLNKISKMG